MRRKVKWKIIPVENNSCTEINFYLKGRMSSFLKSKYHYSFLISASERPVIRCIKSTEQLSLRISFAVSRFA